MTDVFPYNECDTCQYFCDDGADALGFVYVSCGRDPFDEKLKCPHKENKENKK